MQLAAANTQIVTRDLCGIQGHSSETCAAILEQQPSERVNYMGNIPRQPNFNPHSKTYNPGWKHHPNFGWGGQGNQFNQGNQFSQGQRQFNNNFQQQTPSLVQPNTSKQPSGLELALQKLTLSTTTFVDGTTNFMNETKATLKNQEASIRNLEVQVVTTQFSVYHDYTYGQAVQTTHL
ncbi:hypothetical protein PIB30_092347, partial [Stylosanthes scabra]|nr:hypothetical protein [Stylosanthes scabra]